MDYSKALEVALEAHGFSFYKCEGKYKGQDETSYLVPTLKLGSIRTHDLLALARVHKQESIIVGNGGGWYDLRKASGEILKTTNSISFHVNKGRGKSFSQKDDRTRILDSPFSFELHF